MGKQHLNAEKMIQKLEKYVSSGNYYEAQQMYKSVHARYKSQGDAKLAMDLLQSGACIQLKHGQVNCGSELAVILIEDFISSGIKYSEEHYEIIKLIYSNFPKEEKSNSSISKSDGDNVAAASDNNIHGSNSDEQKDANANLRVEACTSFLKTALKWSGGAPPIYDMIADYYWSQSPSPSMSIAAKYFIHGNNPQKFADAIMDCMCQCYKGEVDLVLSRAVLQYAAIGNLRDANYIFEEVKKRSSELQSFGYPLPQTPLLNFMKFLLLTLERDAVPLFRMLRSKYKTSIDRDPQFNDYLDEIGYVFYHIPKASGMSAMFGDLMKMLSGDD